MKLSLHEAELSLYRGRLDSAVKEYLNLIDEIKKYSDLDLGYNRCYRSHMLYLYRKAYFVLEDKPVINIEDEFSMLRINDDSMALIMSTYNPCQYNGVLVGVKMLKEQLYADLVAKSVRLLENLIFERDLCHEAKKNLSGTLMSHYRFIYKNRDDDTYNRETKHLLDYVNGAG